jgi:hypothetical protein
MINCSESFILIPVTVGFAMMLAASSAAVTANAQHEPQAPWLAIGMSMS